MTWWSNLFHAFMGTPGRQTMAPVTGHPEDAGGDLQVDDLGWLVGVDVEQVPSVRHSALTAPHGPFAIVWHYTATSAGTAKSLAKRIRTYRNGVDRAASWHVIIGQDGKLWQSVPFLRGAWHCGRGSIRESYWLGPGSMWTENGPHPPVYHHVNGCSIGIELENLDGKSFPWQQVEAAVRLASVLVHQYGIAPRNASWSHSSLDPSRRSDPGPVWESQMRSLLEAAYHTEDLPL